MGIGRAKGWRANEARVRGIRATAVSHRSSLAGRRPKHRAGWKPLAASDFRDRANRHDEPNPAIPPTDPFAGLFAAGRGTIESDRRWGSARSWRSAESARGSTAGRGRRETDARPGFLLSRRLAAL